MGSIRIIAAFTAIAPDDVERFKATVRELSGLVGSETGTLEYSYYLTADERRCLMIEEYAGEEDLAAHMGHVGHLLGPLFESGGAVDVSILGDVPASLIEATSSFHPTIYAVLSEKERSRV